MYGNSQGRDSPKLQNIAAWQLINQLGNEILLRFLFVLGRREAGFDCPAIWHSPIPVWQLPKSLLAENLLHKQLVETGVKNLPNQLLNIGEFSRPSCPVEQKQQKRPKEETEYEYLETPHCTIATKMRPIKYCKTIELKIYILDPTAPPSLKQRGRYYPVGRGKGVDKKNKQIHGHLRQCQISISRMQYL
jgi:hypothetical protein